MQNFRVVDGSCCVDLRAVGDPVNLTIDATGLINRSRLWIANNFCLSMNSECSR